MLQRIREARKNESGFTLIELLIVIVILGILAAVVVFSVSGLTDRGTANACKSDYSTVLTAGEAFIASTGHPANNIGELSPGYLHSPPTDIVYSLAGNSFTLAYQTTGNAAATKCAGQAIPPV